MSSIKLTKLQRYIIGAVAVIALGIAVLINSAANKPPQNNGGLYPQNGSYTIVAVQDVVCTFSDPPTCSGRLLLSEGDPSRTEAKIGHNTKVRYQSKEIQIYPNALEEGMVGEVTFSPGSNIIETMVIAD